LPQRDSEGEAIRSQEPRRDSFIALVRDSTRPPLPWLDGQRRQGQFHALSRL
jgi:hypothetical protein